MVKSLVLFVLLDVVEAEGEDLDDDLKKDFRPIVFLIFGFSCHGGMNLCCCISRCGSPRERFALRASER